MQWTRPALLASIFLCALASAAWAIDPVSVSVDTPWGPLETTVTPGTWSDDGDGKYSGSGTQNIVFAGQSYTLDATWAGVAFDVPTKKLTSGTIELTFATGPATASVGLDVELLKLSLDAATGIATIAVGEIRMAGTDGGVGLTMSSIDLTGSTIALAPSGLIYVSYTTQAPLSILGVNLATGAELKLDLSDTEAAPNDEIPDADLPTGASGGPWRGFRIEAATVAFGETAAAASGVATLDFLNVGWPGAITGLPAFKGRVTATSTAPLAGKLFGVEVSLKPSGDPSSGILRFDSTSTTGAVQGTFDGTVKLPGASADMAVTGLSVSYAGGEGFQFIVDSATVTAPPEGLGLELGPWSAHAKVIGIDASKAKKLTQTPGSDEAESWEGVVIYDGDLSFPVPGAHDGSVLALDLKDVVVPFDRPEEFDGWLLLKDGADSALASIGDLKIQATNTDTADPPLNVAASEAPGDTDTATSVFGHTHFHFVGGALASGCLYGLLTIPGVQDPVPFGWTVDADGNLIAGVSVAEIKVGQGDGAIVFSDVVAKLDLSQATSPSPQAASPEWTGLVLVSATVTLPSPFACTITAAELVWDDGLSGTLTAADLHVAVGNTDNFAATLDGFSMTFAHGAVASVTADGTMNAMPFIEEVALKTEYDSATGFVIKAVLEEGVSHTFGGTDALKLTFTGLEIKIPTQAAHDAGARASLRMDGSAQVVADGAPLTGVAFEDVQLLADGTVNSGGAWVDLREHASWEFQKFKVDVREIGFGSIPSETLGGKNQVWIGLSGGLALSDMWGMSLDVQADKFRWFGDPDPGFAVEEVRVEATVKETVNITGKVKYLKTPDKREFRGQVDVTVAVGGGSFHGGIQFVSGHVAAVQGVPEFDYWGVAGSFQLPTAVPLGSTGLGLYGVNGGVAKGLIPTSVNLYEWTPSAVAEFAFQAGVTIGTYADTGYAFHAGVTMTVLVEPLIIRIDGTGNLLTKMSDVSNVDRVVKASIVYDSTTSTFEASLELGQSDTQPFQLPHILSVRGMAVLSISDTMAFIHVGTKSSPVTARVFPDIGGGITASSWFMVDWVYPADPQLNSFTVSVGAYVGWSFTKEFKICDVTGQIAAGGEVTLTFIPSFSFYGSMSASIGAQACGVGFNLSANCAVSCPTIHLQAACALKISLAVKTINLSFAAEQP